jgi:uncharacterized PurR-regulated membrane protein YhhQ (DUF165 family)
MNQSKPNFMRLLPSVIAMGLVILMHNVLVQIPIYHVVILAGRSFNLVELLTWGAFTYPVAFLVADTTRIYGMQTARRVV